MDKNTIEKLKQLFPYKSEYDPDKYMETVMDYIYSEIVDELITN